MIAGVKQAIEQTPYIEKATYIYSHVDYSRIEESRKKQLAACQQLRDNGYKVHACAFSKLHAEYAFLIRATRLGTQEQHETQQKAYKEWKTYHNRHGCVHE